jgi:hypothetical protein
LQVSNRSSPDDHDYHDVRMEYDGVDIGGDYTELNTASSATLDHEAERRPPEAVSVDVWAGFHDPSEPWDVEHSELSETFAFNIFGEV